MAEPLLSNPDPDAPALVGGEYGQQAFQSVEGPSGERTVGQVPRATMVQPAPLPSDFGVFHDLVPQEPRAVGGVDFGVFSDLIPKPPPSITPASDAVVSASKDIIGGPQVFSPEEEKAAVMNAPDWAQALARPAVSAGKLLAGQIPTSTEQLTSMVPMLTGTGTRGLGGFVGEAAKAGVSLAANMKATTTTQPFSQEWWDNVMPVAMAGLQAAGIGLHELPMRVGKPPVQVPPVQTEVLPTGPPVQTRAAEPAAAMRPPPETPTTEATAEPTIVAEPAPETPAAAEQPPTVAEPAPDFITSDHPLAANLKPIGGTEPAFARKTAQDLFDQGKPVYSVLPDGEEAVRIKSAADIGKYDPSELHVLEPAPAAPAAAPQQIKLFRGVAEGMSLVPEVQDAGVHFAENPQLAKKFGGENATVHEVTATIHNPIKVSDPGRVWDHDEIVDEVLAARPDIPDDALTDNARSGESQDLAKWLKAHGIDALYYDDVAEAGGKKMGRSWILFDHSDFKPPAAPAGEAKAAVKNILNQYDSGSQRISTGEDIAKALSDIEGLPPSLQKAVTDFNEALRVDREEYGQRSGLPEDAENALMDEVRKYAGTTEEAPAVAPTEPVATEPDFSHITDQQTLSREAGGMIMKAKTTAEMQAVQRALKKRAAELQAPPQVAEPPRGGEAVITKADYAKHFPQIEWPFGEATESVPFTDVQVTNAGSKSGVGGKSANWRVTLKSPTGQLAIDETFGGGATGKKAANAFAREMQAKLQPRVTEPPLGGEAAAAKAPVETTSGIYPKANVRSGNPNFDVTPADLGVAHPLPEFMMRAVNGLTTGTSSGSGFINSIKATVGAAMNKTFPKTTLADRVAGEKMARWVASKDAAPYLSDVHAAQVLENTKVDPNKLGAALTEDNLRSVRATSETPEAVNTIIGAKGSPFKTEEMYQKFLADPDVQKAIERHKALWGEVVDPMYRKAMQIDPSETLPSRGEQTGARINLMPIVEGGPQRNVVQSIGRGNLTGTMRRKSPFGRRAKGTGESYNTNYFDMMANTYGRQLEIANKNDFENHLVQSGNAVVGKPGERPVLADGEATVGFPLKRTAVAVKATEEGGPPRTIPVNRYLYVRKGLANEYRRAANVDALEVPLILKGITTGANKAALAGLTDASVHTLNLGTGLFTRPSVAGGVISDTLLSLTGRADIPVTLVKAITKSFKDNRAQLAQLAEIGALRAAETKPIRGPMSLMGHTIRWADKTTRLVLDDAYQKMAKAGLVENTETARREFVNQVGQYNLRAQNPLVRMSRESGLAPFATAGTTFNALGVRTALMSPGVKAASPLAAAALRANVLSKWVGGFTLVGALNYMITKKLWGRPGTPIGSVDTGRDDDNGNPLTYNVFAILGLSRAMRATGIRGVIEAKKLGLNNLNALDAGFRDAFNTWISPFAGPTPRLIAGLTNQPIGIGLPKPHPIAAPGESQTIENVKGSIIEANPIAASIADLHKVGGSEKKAIQRQLPRLTLTPGRPADFVANYPQIVERAQTRAFIDDVIGRARRLDPDKREIFIEDSLNRIPEDQRRWALRTIRQARLGGSVSPIVRTSQ